METEDTRPYVFEEIPTLKQLMPSTAGLPGVDYAVVHVENIRRAQDEGWSRLHGRQRVFTIQGPKGFSDCELYGRGDPIQGQDPSTGKRRLFIDKKVRQLTGHGAPEEKKTPAKVEAK